MGGSRMQYQLDRDVYQVISKYQADRDDLPMGTVTSPAIYQYIVNSNSSLKRQKKAILLASIDRILQAYSDDQPGGRASEATSGDDEEEERAPIAQDNLMNQAIRGNLGIRQPAAKQDGPRTPVNGVESPTIQSSNNKRQPARSETAAPKRRKTSEKTWVTEANGPGLEDLAGIDSIIDELSELVAFPMLHPQIYLDSGISPTRGILLHGPPGCGKTALANAFANKLSVAFISVSAPSLVGGMSGESEKSIRDLFAEAAKQAPCLVFLDEIDAIIPKRESAQREMEKRIVAQMLTCMDDLSLQKTGGRPVIVMAATNRPDSLDEAMRRAGRFNKEISMPVPDLLAREQILKAMTRNLQLAADVDFVALAKLTPGYVGADLGDLVSTASVMSIKRSMAEISKRLAAATSIDDPNSDMQLDLPLLSSPSTALTRLDLLLQSRTAPPPTLTLEITNSDLTTSLSKIQPSSLREGFATVPTTTFSEIGGNAALRRTLELAIIYPIRSPTFYAQVGISSPAGVLLWGPPGCGKTLLAKAVANESGANFISVKGPELLNKYVGESERAVRKLFERARSSVPVLIFFDELDALVPRRSGGAGDDGGGSSSGGGTEASSRVVNTLLAELDGVGDAAARRGIHVMAATNRPDIIDRAMLRPGRLDRCCFVDLPTREERGLILAAVVRDRKIPVHPDVRLGDVALDSRTEGMSGADLVAVLKAAGIAALERHYGDLALQHRDGLSQDALRAADGKGKLWVLDDDFAEALRQVKPSVTDISRYRALANSPKWGGTGRERTTSRT